MASLNITREEWVTVSRLLDEVFELPPAQRAAWLTTLDAKYGAVRLTVEKLLHAEALAETKDFLEALPQYDQNTRHLTSDGSEGDDFLEGAEIGPYRLKHEIGRGGMGAVWLAERTDGSLKRPVALKLLRPGFHDRQFAERFGRERDILAGLTHPNIARLYDAGITTDGQPFLALEYVEGATLTTYCDRHTLDLRRRIDLFLQVLDAVQYAHRNLVVHRDLKPSNILVNNEGQIRLLDFGIAKLLVAGQRETNETELTRLGGRAHTPDYASPEQVAGAPITTGSDIYSLGVVLYELFCGKRPYKLQRESSAALEEAILSADPVPPSRVVGADAEARNRGTTHKGLVRELKGDLDTIVLKGLKKNPAERYATADALAQDLRHYLNSEPVDAQPDSLVYRSTKFVRRNRLPVAAAAVILLGLSLGLFAVNRERAIAERRFVQVRQLANKLFDIDAQVRNLPGSAKARQLIVDTSLEYLGRLATEVKSDPELALDVGTAYMRVARVQGVPISANIGQLDQAEQNLRTAEALINSVLAAQPGNRTAFLRRAQIAHDRMTLASLRRPDDEALPLARQSAQWLDKYLDTGSVEPAEVEQVMIVLSNVANRYRIKEQFDEALSLVRRGLEIGRSIQQPAAQLHVGTLLLDAARIHRNRGALDEALESFREAAGILEPPPGTMSQGRTLNFARGLTQEGQVLGDSHGVSLGRPEEALVLLQRAFRVVDEIVHQDPNDANSRGHLSSSGLALANLLRESDDRQALDVYDHVLRHLDEVTNYPRFRRDEVRVLADSTYSLRRLGRSAEARQRLGAAFERLSQLKLYPADQIDLGSEADDALRALADIEAGSGNLSRAIEIYQELLDGILAAKPNTESNLADASRLSRLYSSMAAVQRRSGKVDQASELDTRRLKLWQDWERKLPNNAFVLRQLAATRVN